MYSLVRYFALGDRTRDRATLVDNVGSFVAFYVHIALTTQSSIGTRIVMPCCKLLKSEDTDDLVETLGALQLDFN